MIKKYNCKITVPCPIFLRDYAHYIDYVEDNGKLLFSHNNGCDLCCNDPKCVTCISSTYQQFLDSWNEDPLNNV